MANEGLGTRSVCHSCHSADFQPITTSATHQLCGNPTRAVRYLCSNCNTVLELPPIPPCPLPLSILQAVSVAPAGITAFLSLLNVLIDYETLETCVRALLTGKSVGTDGIPREFYKYGPRPLLELLRTAFSAYLSGNRPTVCGHEWMGTNSRRQAPKGDPPGAHTTRAPPPRFYTGGWGGLAKAAGIGSCPAGLKADPHKGLRTPLTMDGCVREG